MYNDNYLNGNANANASACVSLDAGVSSEPIEPMVAIVEGIIKATETALSMVYKINEHLFGMGEPTKEEGLNPRCFRDVMVKQRIDINELCCELSAIQERLGI